MNFNKENFINFIEIQNKKYKYFSIKKIFDILNLEQNESPFISKIIIENYIRNKKNITEEDIKILSNIAQCKAENEITLMPTRILMQDFTGIPALVDLAAMRDAVKLIGKNPSIINPIIPIDLIIDHSLQVDYFGIQTSKEENIKKEYERNKQRYEFLKWCKSSFSNLSIVPPGNGICHQINLEFLSKAIHTDSKNNILFPEIIIGTDSHTTMINGIGVLGWGVGGIEAEISMLGHPITMPMQEIIGVIITGEKNDNICATDIVLHITNILRKKNVTSKFVEFCGDGLKTLTAQDRATIANMSPEYGATCGFFPIDKSTISYLLQTGRSYETIKIIEKYTKTQYLINDYSSIPKFNDIIEINLNNIKTSFAGPKHPHGLLQINEIKNTIQNNTEQKQDKDKNKQKKTDIKNGDIIIAAITSCTNTSNPYLMIEAGLLAKNLFQKNLLPKPWVKTSFAPGSKVVAEYLTKLNLTQYLDKLGFNIIGFGCTTCIGNSGPINEEISQQIITNNLNVASVLSGNRNFEGRIHKLAKSNYLMSPAMVIAYSIVGSIMIDLSREPLGFNEANKPIYLKDVMPKNNEINLFIQKSINSKMFIETYSKVFEGDKNWTSLNTTEEIMYKWDEKNSYIKKPPYFNNTTNTKNLSIENGQILAIFGDNITTDHISPAGSISVKSPAGKFLMQNGINENDFNSYGSRRGNHEIMTRGTFSNPRIKNLMIHDKEGGFTLHVPTNQIMTIYDAAMEYKKENKKLIIIAGKYYGAGSSRDWAAKGTALLNVNAVIAESFERIHLSNLIGMGILPLQFTNEQNIKNLSLLGNETIEIHINKEIKPIESVKCTIQYKNKTKKEILLKLMAKTTYDIECLKYGGALKMIFNEIAKTEN